MPWRTAFNWVEPRTPPAFGKGRLVIQDDDGNIGAYTHVFGMTQRKDRQYNSWRGFQVVPFCPAIVSSYIGQSNMMSVQHLHAIVNAGGEILSHGRTHTGLHPHYTTAEIPAGSTVIPIDSVGRSLHAYEYTITGGGNSETFLRVGRSPGSATTNGELYTATPLVHGYPIGSEVRVTEAGMYQELQGCVDDLATWGIDCRHHVWPWNQSDQVMRDFASTIFESACGAGNPPLNIPGDIDLYNLNRRNLTSMSYADIDELIQLVIDTDGVGIVYGHGETSASSQDKLAYLIDKAISQGVRIVTHSEAVKYLTSVFPG